MSSVTLRMIEIENYGRFYDPAKLVFDDRISAVVLGPSQGKSTFVNALEFLSEAVLEGNIRNRASNFCRTYINKPKNFIRIEVLLDIRDATHNGIYRYGIRVTDVGVLSEYLLKEGTERRVFYRYKNEIELLGLSDDMADHVKATIGADVPVLHLLRDCKSGIPAYFIRYFQRLWIIRADGSSYRLSASHLFKSSFFTRRANIERCCEFLRLFDPTVVDMIKVPNTSKVLVVRKNSDGYEYPVALSNESDSFIKLLALFRAIDALSAYGGTVFLDVGNIYATSGMTDYFRRSDFECVNIVFMTENDSLCQRLSINKAKNIGF